VIRAVRAGSERIHIHAFTALEVTEGARRSGVPLIEYLATLKEAGLKTLPGTAAEILDDEVRAVLCPDKVNTEEWLEAHRCAHAVGLNSNVTIMFGSIEQPRSWARHMIVTRRLQRETGGFTEFVPLSFVHEEAPMTLRHQVPELRPGPTGDDVIRLYAISRLMLGSTIRNLQVSWVKDGMRQAQWLLSCGANDFGGTLINESISTSAGASYGQLQTPAALRRAIRDAGRIPVERSTRYDVLRRFSREPGADERDPLDGVDDPEAVFGSYDRLTRDERFRFRLPVAVS
jgi:FO synthase subunit 2